MRLFKKEQDHQNLSKKTQDKYIEGVRVPSLQQKIRKDNYSGHKGVTRDSRVQKWHAYIGLKGKSMHLGYFVDKRDAITTRIAAEEKFHKPYIEKFVENTEETEKEGTEKLNTKLEDTELPIHVNKAELSKHALYKGEISQQDLSVLLNVTRGAINGRLKRGTLPPFDGHYENGRGWWLYETVKALLPVGDLNRNK
ncbi:hypothetical protein ACFOQM_23360 [Paenibacillus sp. GCM10012307]|uniref:AP2 domain-containing protein n=1 Tax=Paenibacillus roseus TaxID=2798579 RepID=A0A934MSQ0_9BACL|nr:hypothetical protein [Paenibacillus roseus]MBJ6364163.1 hypothetical protein [Paenibacillus roseus]